MHLRHCLLYEFDRKSTPAKAAENICQVYGIDAVTERTCRRWFAKFREGDRSLEDEPRSGRPSTTPVEALLQLVQQEPKLTSREFAARMGVDHQTVLNHLAENGYVLKLGKWLPHDLTESDRDRRMTCCDSLLSRFAKEPFF